MNNLNLYKIVVLAADTGSFSRTAAMMNTVPSNISRIVRKQEDELGFPIFNRLNNKVTVTEIGKKYVEHARDILQKEYEFYSNIELFYPHDKIIRIGLGPYFTANIFKLYYSQFSKFYPNVKFNVITKSNSEVYHMLEHNLIDIAIIEQVDEFQQAKEFDVFHKFNLTAHFYTVNKEYINKTNIEANDKILNKLVLPYYDSPLRRLVDNYFALNNIKINPVVVTDNIPIIFDLIYNNNCTGILFD